MKGEGWLILTENTLNWYDRDPRGTTRKPVHSCSFDSPKYTLVVLPSIDRRSLPYSTPTKQIDLTFGIEKIGASSCDKIMFIAQNIQSKIEWVEAIRMALLSHSNPQQIDTARSVSLCDDPDDLSSPATKAKKLKAVTIVPVRTGVQRSSTDASSTHTPPSKRLKTKQNTSSESTELDLSIRSSMLGSPSDTSFV